MRGWSRPGDGEGLVPFACMTPEALLGLTEGESCELRPGWARGTSCAESGWGGGDHSFQAEGAGNAKAQVWECICYKNSIIETGEG